MTLAVGLVCVPRVGLTPERGTRPAVHGEYISNALPATLSVLWVRWRTYDVLPDSRYRSAKRQPKPVTRPTHALHFV